MFTGLPVGHEENDSWVSESSKLWHFLSLSGKLYVPRRRKITLQLMKFSTLTDEISYAKWWEFFCQLPKVLLLTIKRSHANWQSCIILLDISVKETGIHMSPRLEIFHNLLLLFFSQILLAPEHPIVARSASNNIIVFIWLNATRWVQVSTFGQPSRKHTV